MALNYDTVTDLVRSLSEVVGVTYVEDDLPTRIATMFLWNLRGRSGFDGWWDACDDETQREILASLIQDAEEVITASTYREPTTPQWTEMSVQNLTDRMKDAEALQALNAEVTYLHRAFVVERMLLVDMLKGVISEDDFPIKGKDMPPSLAFLCRVFVLLIDSIPSAKNFVVFGFTDPPTGREFSVRVTRGGGMDPESLAQNQARRIAELETQVASDAVYLSMCIAAANTERREMQGYCDRLLADGKAAAVERDELRATVVELQEALRAGRS